MPKLKLHRWVCPRKRFWLRVDKLQHYNGCWIWTGAKDKFGYGKITINRKTQKCHRFSWQIYNGDIPEGLQVLHRCDNPSCVNPNHLFLGTQTDNMKDMYSKGRNALPPGTGKVLGMAQLSQDNPAVVQGERNGNSRLTEDQVMEIRSLYVRYNISARNVSPDNSKELSIRFGVSTNQIKRIARGEMWKHI